MFGDIIIAKAKVHFLRYDNGIVFITFQCDNDIMVMFKMHIEIFRDKII